MKPFLFAILLFALSPASAQHTIGIGLDLGASRIYPTDFSEGGIRYNFFPSGNLGAYYRFKPETSKSNLLVEFMVSQIEGKVFSENVVTDANLSVIGKETYDLYYHVTSLSLPIYYGIQFKKIGFLIGGETAFPVHSGYNLRRNIQYYDVNETSKEKGSPLYLDPIHFYARFGLEWIVSEKLLLRASYSHGIHIITKENGLPWKSLQATLGIRYLLWKK